MIMKLKIDILELYSEPIRHFLTETEDEEMTSEHPISPDILTTAFKKVGGKIDYDSVDTNGWEVDYWYQATYKGEKFMLSGSAWYGSAQIMRGWDE